MPAVPDCLKDPGAGIIHDQPDSGDQTIVLAGGVSANSVLRAQMRALCKKNGWHLYAPDLPLCGDNAAMVGAQGYHEFLAGHVSGPGLNAYATMPIDAVTF